MDTQQMGYNGKLCRKLLKKSTVYHSLLAK